MKIALNVLGVLLVLFGSIWFLQGVNVLPGSFMTGQIRWAVHGGIAMIAGIVLLVSAKAGDAGAPDLITPVGLDPRPSK